MKPLLGKRLKVHHFQQTICNCPKNLQKTHREDECSLALAKRCGTQTMKFVFSGYNLSRLPSKGFIFQCQNMVPSDLKTKTNALAPNSYV